MYLSSWLNEIVELPVDPNDYFEKLQEKISTSTFEKKNVTNTILNDWFIRIGNEVFSSTK